MKKCLIFFLLLSNFVVRSQMCNALFSFGAYFETVTFYNQSSASNAHYYWNFGDGTSSGFKSPIHTFPENGIYLVSLYVLDTISNCSSYYDMWLNVKKLSSDPCNPSINDSIFNTNGTDYIKIINNSVNCTNYSRLYDASGAANMQATTFKLWMAGNYLTKVHYYSGQVDKRFAWKTSPFNYNRSKNYGNCSANFEFKVVSQNDTLGQRILFTAMNRSADDYTWTFIGFGNPEYYKTDTISHFFPNPFLNSTSSTAWPVRLKTKEQNGCTDSLMQHISVLKRSLTIPTGIIENTIEGLAASIFPNPVKDKLHVELEYTAPLDKLSILNTLGQEVYSLVKPGHEQEIDVSQFPTGVYFLKAGNKQGQAVFKIVKE